MPLTQHQPRGLLRWALRLPVWLYRLHLGWLLGERFLLLIHIGRRTGRPRQAVIEVLRHDAATDAYLIAAAWSERSDWFRNIQRRAQVTLLVGRRRLAAQAEVLPTELGARELQTYAQRHPRAFQEITRWLADEPVRGTAENCRRLAESVPIVRLRPLGRA